MFGLASDVNLWTGSAINQLAPLTHKTDVNVNAIPAPSLLRSQMILFRRASINLNISIHFINERQWQKRFTKSGDVNKKGNKGKL